MVVIVPRPGAAPLQAADIAEWCRAHLAPMKVPRYVAFAESLPHTPSHRVAKHRLKAQPDLIAGAVDTLAK
jgi:crotonobetaine/carnitine-CoA ligase